MSDNIDKNLRLAVRFMTAYNQKLLVAFRKICELFDKDECSITFYSTRFDWPSQKILNDNWAWDYLPLTFPCLQIVKGEENIPPWSVIFVEHIADNGILPFEVDFERSPFTMPDVDECSTIWAVRYFSAKKKAIPISDDHWDNEYNQCLQAVFENQKVWSYDLRKCPQIELEANNFKYGHFLFDANDVLLYSDFDKKIMNILKRLGKEI